MKILPYRLRVPFMGWLTARILAPVAGYQRRIRENLAHVLPDLPEAEVRRLLYAVPDNIGRGMIEMYSTREFMARARNSPVTGPGMETVRAAHRDGRPLILISGHFGNFNATRVAVAAQGIAYGGLYRPIKNRYFNAHYARALGALSQPLFEQGRRGMVQMVKHLRDGGVQAIMTDLNAHDGIPLDFFGKPALTSLITAEMALKFDAPLVPIWCLRRENGLDFEIHVEEPIPPSDPVTMTQEFNDRLETQIRANMDQWFWIHRRWKDGTGVLADVRSRQQAERAQDQNG